MRKPEVGAAPYLKGIFLSVGIEIHFLKDV